QPRPGGDRARGRPEVQCGDQRDRRRAGRCPGRQDRAGAGAPARCPLPRCEGPRTRRALQVRPRRAVRRGGAAVRPGRRRRRALLPTHQSGRRGGREGALGAAAGADPGRSHRAVGSGPMDGPLSDLPAWAVWLAGGTLVVALVVMIALGWLTARTARALRRTTAAQEEAHAELAALRAELERRTPPPSPGGVRDTHA